MDIREKKYADTEHFDDLFNMTTQPSWKAAGICPFCGKMQSARMCGEYVDEEFTTRSGSQREHILIWTQVICRACGGRGPIEERDVLAEYNNSKAATKQDAVMRMVHGNRMLTMSAVSRWNRRMSN